MQVDESTQVTTRSHAGRRCTVCDHDGLPSINRLIAEGKTSNRIIAAQFDISYQSLQRHALKHIPATLQAAIQRRELAEGKRAIAVADHVTEAKIAAADEFMEDIQFSKRFAKIGIERCMTGPVDAETGEVQPAPIDEFRLAPSFLAALDRANALLGTATGRLNAAPQSVTNIGHLSVIMPRAIEPGANRPAIESASEAIDVTPITGVSES